MKVLLINPPQSTPEKCFFPLSVFMPMGLAYVAAVLEKNGIAVEILDALALGWRETRSSAGFETTGLSPEQILEHLQRVKPDVVGITAPFTTQERNVFAVARLVKQYNPRVPVVVGGPHPSIQSARVMQCRDIDHVIVAEGEYSFLEFVQKLARKEDVTGIPGLVSRKGDQFLRNSPQAIMDLDALPFPAYHLLPMEEYYAAALRVRASRSISTYRKRWATLVTSRGCPYQCIFCSIKPTMGYKWRARSAANVLAEMEHLIRHYGIRHFDVEDDNFSLGRERFDAILDGIIERKLGIEWSTPNGIMAQTLDEDLIRKMKLSGCTRAIFAPESGDPEVLRKIVHKNIDLQKVENAVRWCRKYRLKCECFFVLGFPGETLENLKRTVEFARRMRALGADSCAFFLAIPYYGTELRRIAEEKGYLRKLDGDDCWNFLSGEPLLETEDFTAEQLKQIWIEAQKMNSWISVDRIKIAAAMLVADPLRFVHFVVQLLRRLRG